MVRGLRTKAKLRERRGLLRSGGVLERAGRPMDQGGVVPEGTTRLFAPAADEEEEDEDADSSSELLLPPPQPLLLLLPFVPTTPLVCAQQLPRLLVVLTQLS